MNIRVGRSVLAAVVALPVLLAPVSFAHAAETSSTVELLARRSGALPAELQVELEKTAPSVGMSAEELAEAMLESLPDQNPGAANQGFSSSGGGGGTRMLGDGHGPGDLFYSGGGVGHVGMFVDKKTTVEAVGLGETTQKRDAKNVPITKGKRSAKMRVTVGDGAREDKLRKSAVAWALKHTGRAYNAAGFAVNRVIEADKYNCSQYVWAAFKQAGLDLDTNAEVKPPRGVPLPAKNLGVYPYEIRDSKSVHIYENL